MRAATEKDAVGIVGLGLVGQALAGRLLAAGYAVHGFDLREEACDALHAAGGSALDSIRAVGAACPCVVLAVFDTSDVVRVLEAGDGLLGPHHQVHTVIDCSTGDPQALQALSARLHARGVAFIEGPLSGSSQQIAAGEATMLLGGDAEASASTSAVPAWRRRRSSPPTSCWG